MKPDPVWIHLGRGGLAILLAAILATGCTTMRPVAKEGAALAEELEPGDRVHIVTQKGELMDFQIAQVSPERIEGDGRSVEIKDIARVERQEISGWKSAGLSLFIGVIVLGIVSIIVLSNSGIPVQ